MAYVAIVASPLGIRSEYRQTIMQDCIMGSFVADDTDNHQLKVKSAGKGRLTVAVDNPANQTITATIYGMHAAAGAIGDVGTFLVGSFTVTAANDKGYEVVNDPFPFYLIDLAYSVPPDDSPLKTATVYVDFSAF